MSFFGRKVVPLIHLYVFSLLCIIHFSDGFNFINCSNDLKGKAFAFEYQYYSGKYLTRNDNGEYADVQDKKNYDGGWYRGNVRYAREQVWITEPAGDNHFYLRSATIDGDYIYDAPRGDKAARLSKRKKAKFRVDCVRCSGDSQTDCQIKNENGRKLYTNAYKNTKFCHNCGSTNWFKWSFYRVQKRN